MIRGPIAGGWNWVDAGEVEGGILVARETCDEGEKTSLGCGDDFGCFRICVSVDFGLGNGRGRNGGLWRPMMASKWRTQWRPTEMRSEGEGSG